MVELCLAMGREQGLNCEIFCCHDGHELMRDIENEW